MEMHLLMIVLFGYPPAGTVPGVWNRCHAAAVARSYTNVNTGNTLEEPRGCRVPGYRKSASVSKHRPTGVPTEWTPQSNLC
eukprot:3936196-Rhodomonas_salina.4